MLQEMVEYAIEHRTSQSTPHKIFYHRVREKYSWLPARVIKGCYRDTVRRAKSFRELKKKGLALDRDVIGAINIGLKHLSSDGSPMQCR